jgi:hypothetical protein
MAGNAMFVEEIATKNLSPPGGGGIISRPVV